MDKIDEFLYSGYEPSPTKVSEIKTPRQLEVFKEEPDV